MRNKFLISVNILLIGLVLFLSDAAAEQRMVTFEMGESGQTVSFPMSLEEIALADAEAARAKVTKNTRSVQPKKWVNRIEQPESGNYIEFPMTDEEIQIAIKKAEQDKSDLNRRKSNALNDREEQGEVFEMADGQTIIFYKNKSTKWGAYPF